MTNIDAAAVQDGVVEDIGRDIGNGYLEAIAGGPAMVDDFNRFFATASERTDECQRMTLLQKSECRGHAIMTVWLAVRDAT
ncbi:MAG: hypothetical protein QOG61_1933 [Candidatus Binataceae bacterium]|jgi:hypothetical protein|nr:hypothetical protein [Candidatus Binataceae bacterium]